MENGSDHGLSPPSIFRIASSDRVAIQGLFALSAGIIIISLQLVFSSPPIGSSDHPNYPILLFGVLLFLVGAFLLIRRVRAVSAIFVNGVRVKARITKWEGVMTKAYVGYEAKLTYEIGGHTHHASAHVPDSAPSLDSLNVGDSLSLVVDQKDPKRFLVLEAFESNDVLMGHLRKECEVCGTGMLLKDMEDHMAAMHPEAHVHTKRNKLVMRMVILAGVALSILSILRWGNSWQSAAVMGLCVIAVIAMIGIAVALEDKRLARAQHAWQGSHEGQDKARHDD